MTLEFEEYVRKPFLVEVVRITRDNIEEIAEIIGELCYEGSKPYIKVNKNVVPGINRVHVGYYMTRMGDNIRCYNKRVFASQFCPSDPEIVNWVNYIRATIAHQQQGMRAQERQPEEVASG